MWIHSNNSSSNLWMFLRSLIKFGHIASICLLWINPKLNRVIVWWIFGMPLDKLSWELVCLNGPKYCLEPWVFFSLFWNVMTMWDTSNHKQTRKAKWKSYSLKQEGQGHILRNFHGILLKWNCEYIVKKKYFSKGIESLHQYVSKFTMCFTRFWWNWINLPWWK
jgi:hypothetical protein